jgi:bacterioferritin (cytochrome b1)
MTLPTEALIARLQIDLTRKTNSFSEYITHSSPYVAAGQEGMLEVVARHAKEERECAVEIARLIVALGGVPETGLFDEGAADTNYLSITHLFRMLLVRREKDLRMTEERIRDCDGHPAARELMLRVREMEERQLSELTAVLGKCDAA